LHSGCEHLLLVDADITYDITSCYAYDQQQHGSKQEHVQTLALSAHQHNNSL
jgi:hypothetical protein